MFITIFSAILSVALIEVMLSIDNALVNASLAKKLPHHLQKKALYAGIAFGALFKIIGLLLVTFIITNPLIKILSALYLFWLAYEHLFAKPKEGWELKKRNAPHFIIIQLAIANLVFSIDNIIGVIGISSHIFYIISGVLLGMIVLLFITPFVLKLMHRFPSLEKMTYVLLVYIGATILLDEFLHIAVPEYITFIIILISMFLTMYHDRKTFLQA
jgi:YkoY family integral membrane protein